MKQISLFDSFNKTKSKQQKDIDPQNKQKCSQKQIKASSQSQDENNNINIQWGIKKQNQRKSKKLTIDSDQQMENNVDQDYVNNQADQMSDQDEFDKYNADEKRGNDNKKISATKTNQKPKKETQNKISEQKELMKSQKLNPQDQNNLGRFTQTIPKWAQKQYCKDALKRSPDHPQYDPTTLYVPQTEWPKFTSPMKQFWKIKSQNFDKVVLFKFGKFYQMFYDDAVIGNKYLGLKYAGTKMHTGFPQKTFNKYSNQLVKLGFKVVIVEQMQTPNQMAQRVKTEKRQGKKSSRTINRQVTQILTKGTMIPNQQLQDIYLPNYLLSLRILVQQFAFALLEIGTNEIFMGLVHNFQDFKTILYQTRPVQVIYDPDNVPNDICRMMEKSFLQMQMSKVINKNNIWHPLTAICQIDRLEKQANIKKPKIFEIINEMSDMHKNLIFATLSGMFDYLKKVRRFDYVIGTARFEFYQKDKHKKSLILDSQALQHLQIFQTAQGENGSLFKTIDRTKTKFGKRLLRRWMISPLINTSQLNQRLNAIQDLQQYIVQRDIVSTKLKKLPDLQKKANKLYHYAVKNTSASKAIYFEDVHANRLKQFKQFMQKLEDAWQALMVLSKLSNNFKSRRLRRLVNLDKNSNIIKEQVYNEDSEQQNKQGILPNIINHLQQFKGYIKWQGNTPNPQKGLVVYFDQLLEEIENTKQELQKYLDKLRYQLNEPNLKFVNTKERYEIEIPEKSEKRRPKDFEFSSKRQGFSRYISPFTKSKVKQLQKLQENLKEQLGLFVGFFFQQFKKKHSIWQKFIQILGEIDCLISLSQYSFMNSKVRPEFCQQNKFQIKDAKHPCLTSIEFIPNDIILDRKVMLLTGLNMGGKSTILRTACTLAVLAQIGCYVPASLYLCSPIDRIFTRIGASDMLQLGKSTFFIEMQQTKNVLLHGTERSLVIIDELGRGTSTFDGLAIAYSVLKSIIENIKCFCLFATHYHILLEQFKNCKEVAMMKMGYYIKDETSNQQIQGQNKGMAEKNRQTQIVFLYKLMAGSVDKSFALNIAQKVGISKTCIKLAAQKAEDMNILMQNRINLLYKNVLQFIGSK